MSSKAHWESVYETRPADEVSWYQSSAALSVELIRRVQPTRTGPVIDVGGGASVLVDELLALGYDDVSVLDIATAALAASSARLGPLAHAVRWLHEDVLSAHLPSAYYAVWHDRAVFHFLTTRAEREAYVAQVLRAVRPGGHVLVATFAGEGPARCSGLLVERYSPERLHAEFGPEFRLLASEREDHETPNGAHQPFIYCLCRLGDPSATPPRDV
jgi:SAM-dependent methyltransferase